MSAAGSCRYGLGPPGASMQSSGTLPTAACAAFSVLNYRSGIANGKHLSKCIAGQRLDELILL